MRTRVQLLVSMLMVVVAAIASPDASAQSTWNLGGSTCDPTTNNPNSANNCPAGSGSLTATIWGLGNTDANGQFALGQLGAYDPSGFGLYSGTSETGYGSQHAFDNATTDCGPSGGVNTNCGGSQELMLLNFSAAVNLTQMAIGYWGSDADVSILRWDGPADGSANQQNAGNTLQCETSTSYVGSVFSANGVACSASSGTGNNSTASGGWTLVSSMDLLHDSTAVTGVNPNNGTSATKIFNTSAGTGYNSSTSNRVSSWWIISTYNGGATGNTNLGNDGNDVFKILSFTANTCSGTLVSNGTNGTCTSSTPEPGTLALTALAIVGMVAGRRHVARWKRG